MAQNAPPIADAGPDKTVASGSGFLLDGVGSTDDGAIGEYEWWRLDPSTGDIRLLVRNPGLITGVFVTEDILPGDADIVFTYYLNVKDNEGTSCEKQIAGGINGELFCDSVTVTVTAPFADPVARAVTAESEYASGATVTLDGSGSSVDRRRGPISYTWARTGGTGGAVNLSSTTAASPTFTADMLVAEADPVTHTFTLTVTDSTGATATDTVEVTITSPFADPVARAVVTGDQTTVTAGETVTLDGSGSMADRRRTITTYAWAGETAEVTASLTKADEDVATFTAETLTAGAMDVTHTFTLTVTDSAGETATAMVEITVTANDRPVATVVTTTREFASEAPVELVGKGTDSDSDDATLAYAWTRTTRGTSTNALVLTGENTATLRFTADTLVAGTTDVTHVFELVVTDTDGAESDPVEVTIMITAPFAAPVAKAVSAESEYASGATVTLASTGSSVDRRRGPIAYTWARTGGTGGAVTLSSTTAASPTFTADMLEAGAEDVTHTFTLTVTDSMGATATDTVEVTITSPFADPVARAVVTGDQTTVTAGETVMLDGSGSTTDRRRTITTYAWTGETTEVTAALTDADMDVATFTAETLTVGAPDVTHTFTLTVTDSAGETATATVEITVTSNAPPVASVVTSTREFASGTSVELMGSGTDSDSDDATLAYAWTRTTRGTSTNALVLTGKTTATLSFTADTLAPGAADVTHILELVVTDTDGAESDPVAVTVTITSPFAAPNAVAVTAESEYVSGATVTLASTGSSVDRRRGPISYTWARTGGTGGAVTLSSTTAASPTFTADMLEVGAEDVTHTFTLTVTDSTGATATDTVEVTITSPFADPVARAVVTGGQTTVTSGETVMLDGSGSTKDRRRTITTYAWAGETAEVTASLTNADSAVATFTAETLTVGAPDVTHTFTLTVTDSAGETATAMVEITVTANDRPVATVVTTTREFASGTTVELVGRGTDSDSDDTTLAYAWDRTGGTGNDAVVLTGENTATLRFTADTLVAGTADKTHILELVVTDTKGAASDPVAVTITVEAPFAAPNAVAVTAESEYASGATVTLASTGSSVDRRRGPISYTWARTGGTEGVTAPTLTNGDMATATFTAETLTAGAPDVTHTFTLTVTDSTGATDADTVEVTITAPFADPVARAVVTGGQTTVTAGETVTLDGSGSTKDRRRTITTYAWAGETAEVTASLTNADSAVATFTAETLTAGAPDVTHTFTLTVTDSAGETATAMVEITVTANDRPVATVVTTTREFASGTTVELVGRGTDSDSDDTTLAYAWDRTGGTGNDAVVLTGENTATLRFTADTLVAGTADKTHILELVVTDTKGAESDPVAVTITITAPFAAPNAVAVTAESEYASGATVTLASTGSSVDRRRGPISYTWVWTQGPQGAPEPSLSSTTAASPTFTADMLAAGTLDVTHTFTLTVTDSTGATASATVEVTITSPFADPVARAEVEGGQTTVASGETVTLDGSGSTPDRRRTITTFAWTGETAEVTASLTNANTNVATFTAETLTAGAPDVIHTFTLTVTDSAGETATATVEIMVTANDRPVATVVTTTREFASGTTVELVGRGTDSDSDDTTLAYAWDRTGGTGNDAVVLTGENTATLSFTADTLVAGTADKTHILELVVTDAKGAESDPVEVTITITSPIKAPNAVAVTAESEVASGATVTLASTGSSVDRRRGPISYTWAWTSGTEGATEPSLSSTTAASPSFTAETLTAGAPDVTHTFTLTVTDSAGATDADTVEVTVISGFATPVANAVTAQSEVASGATVMLDGGGSTKDRRRTITTYAWTGETAEATASLTNADSAVATFTAETLMAGAPDVTHTFTLTVTDSAGEMDTATVEVTVISGFAAPVANAGVDQPNIASGATVTLDGSGSTKDRRKTLTHAWARADGTAGGRGGAVTLSSTTAEQPTFMAETLAPGALNVTYGFTLTVTDGAVRDDDTVTITVISPFATPVANAVTAQSEVAPGATVTLASTGSSVDRRRTPISYTWARTGGTGANVPLTGANMAMASFTADMLADGAEDVTHTFTLTVTDSTGASAMDTVEVTVTANALPVATVVTTTREFDSGTPVTLEGSGTDSDSDDATLAYAWERTGGTGDAAVTLTGKNTKTLRFTAETLPAGADAVTHIFEFVVTDAEGADSVPVAVTVTVDAPNAPPVAHAGPPPQPIASGGQVQLDGRESMVPGGTIVAWAWSRTGGTPGVTVELIGADTPQPTVMANDLEPGGPDEIHEFTLIVTDDEGMTSVGATVMVTITAPTADPVANAGPDQRAVSKATVRLDGRGSTPDRRKTIASYAWERTGGTSTEPVTLTGANTAQPTFTADTLNPGVEAVTHVFTLTVTDGDGTTSTDTVTVTVVSVDLRLSPSELMVQEGGSGTYQVRLSESPRQEVTIMAVSGNEDVVHLKNARLVFDGGNWNEWQAVEINTVAGSNTDDPVVIRHRLVTDGATSAVPGDVTVTLRARADDPIPAPVGQFLQTRATALINNQPGLSSLLELDGPTPGGSFTFQATDGRLTMNGGFVHNSVWGKVSGAYASSESDGGTTKSVTKSVLASFGVHRKYSEHFLAGVMLQFDLSDHDRAGQVGTTDTIDGTGWLAGPYFAARHGSQPLYFEGRLLYGQSDNDIRFMDTGLGVMRTGSFDTRRLLAQIRVEGEIAMSGRNHGDHGDDGGADGPRLIPYADARWIEDRAAGFADNVNNRVPGQTVSIGQLELGSNVEIPIAVRTGAMTLTGGLGLVWSNTEGDYINSESRSHGRGEIGFSYDLDDNLRIDLDSFYDGIGTSRYEGYGLALSAEMKF